HQQTNPNNTQRGNYSAAGNVNPYNGRGSMTDGHDTHVNLVDMTFGCSQRGTNKMRNLGMVALCAALGGCASSAADIAPAYVPPVAYQSYTCQQLALEAQAISTRAATLSGAQDSQRTKDGVATAAAIVIFWPAAFFVGGDKQTAAELSQMKGQMVAVQQASIQKKCGIQFQGKPPVT